MGVQDEREPLRSLQKRRWLRLPDEVQPNRSLESHLEIFAELRTHVQELETDGATVEQIRKKLEVIDREEDRVRLLFSEGRQDELLDSFGERLGVLLDLAIDTAGRLGFDTDVPIAIAALPTSGVHAQTLPPDSTTRTRYIVIDSGLCVFANLTTKAVARSFPILKVKPHGGVVYADSLEKAEAEIENNATSTVLPYLDVLTRYLTDGDPRRAAVRFADPRWDPINEAWLETIELFCVAHELAHVFQGVKPRLHPTGDAPTQFEDLLDLEITSLDEFRADEIAASIVVTAARERRLPPDNVLLPIAVFLHALDHLIEARFLMQEGSREAALVAREHYYANPQRKDRHPSPSARLDNLQANLVDILGVRGWEGMNLLMSARAKWDLAAGVMDKFSGAIQEVSLLAQEYGKSLHPRWLTL